MLQTVAQPILSKINKYDLTKNKKKYALNFYLFLHTYFVRTCKLTIFPGWEQF